MKFHVSSSVVKCSPSEHCQMRGLGHSTSRLVYSSSEEHVGNKFCAALIPNTETKTMVSADKQI